MKSLTDEELKKLFDDLAKPFNVKDIEWKVQAKFPKPPAKPTSALMVTYSDARCYQDRLDEVVGPQNWYDTYAPGADGGVMATVFLRINGEWIGKSDGASNTDVEATKGGYTNAFKRACVKWGLGRFMYHIPSQYVKLDDKQKPVSIPRIPAEFIRKDDPGRAEYLGEKKAPNPKVVPGKVEPGDELLQLQFAKNHIIPENIGVPLAGQTLGSAMNDAVFGDGIIGYLSGKVANKAGKMFDPGDDKALQSLKKAALTIYNSRAKQE